MSGILSVTSVGKKTDDTVKHERGITMLGILSVTLVGISQMIQWNMRGASQCWGYLVSPR